MDEGARLLEVSLAPCRPAVTPRLRTTQHAAVAEPLAGSHLPLLELATPLVAVDILELVNVRADKRDPRLLHLLRLQNQTLRSLHVRLGSTLHLLPLVHEVAPRETEVHREKEIHVRAVEDLLLLLLRHPRVLHIEPPPMRALEALTLICLRGIRAFTRIHLALPRLVAPVPNDVSHCV